MAGATTVNVDFATRETRKVSGSVRSRDDTLDERAWVAILPVVNGDVDATAEKRWVQTMTDGSFSFELLPGESWTITDVTTSSGYYTTDDPATGDDNEALGFAYEVNAGAIQLPDTWNVDVSRLYPAQ